MTPESLPISVENFAALIKMITEGTISNTMGSKVIGMMFENDRCPDQIVEEHGMAQVSDAAIIREMCSQVLADNEKIVADLRNGKSKALTALVGQVMKQSRGKANPAMVNEILIELLQ